MGKHYKTAKQLGITEGERSVLLLAKAWLAKALPDTHCPIEGNGKFEFYMGRTLGDVYEPEPDCRSEGCIWGLCHILAVVNKIDAFETSPYGKNHTNSVANYGVSEALTLLFFPHYGDSRVTYGTIEPATAARWVESWLETGQHDYTTLI